MSGNGPEQHLEPLRHEATFSLTPKSLEQALQLADLIAKSDLVPKDYQGKAGNVLIAVQLGAEVGLSPMQAIQSIAVINGRPTLYGDGMLAIVQNHPEYEWHDESKSTATEGVCTIKRRGHEPYTQTFTLEDAKRAGLAGKPGPWQTHQKRMLQLRARAFALRDKFADAIRGLGSAEEAIDIAEMMPMDDTPEPPKRQALVDKLKAQLAEQPMSLAQTDEPTPATIETETLTPAETQAMDLQIAKQDFDDRLRTADTFPAAVRVRDDVLASDLPSDFKAGFELRFRQRVQTLQPKKK